MEETAENIVGEFRILERIKSGNQGTVCKAVCEGDSFPLCPRGTVVALKSMSVPSGSGVRTASICSAPSMPWR